MPIGIADGSSRRARPRAEPGAMNDPRTRMQVLEPEATRDLVPRLTAPVWLYRFEHTEHGWIMCIATQGEPGSGKLSLGGFRIVPEARAAAPGFSPEREAIGLAQGMGEKAAWSRLTRVGGPLGLRELDRIVGGKCVLLPTPGFRVGEKGDFELLDWGVSCCLEVERRAGVHLITGQDMGHGVMSDGRTTSLEYLHERFAGSVLEDTSKPTGEGNYWILRGALDALGIPIHKASVGLIGCGNVGMHVLDRLHDAGARLLALDIDENRLRELSERGVATFRAGEKARLVQAPIDALVVNAAGGSLDEPTVSAACENERLRVVCGCENLAMTDPQGVERLRRAKTAYMPTELCGMLGYLTAVEEYLSRARGVRYGVEVMFEAARGLEPIGRRGMSRLVERNFDCTFADAVREVYGENPLG
ncbi:MAG: hypothetical protein D6718_07825 [Acidobacteria bacterium]|nr:MAG: hypothetical protein D6718_07825 [Acidobacteriota bacterium]